MMSIYQRRLTFQCCNELINCQNIIEFQNGNEWYKCTDIYGDKINRYEPQYHSPKRITRSHYDKKYRIFCSDCTRKRLIKCRHCYYRREQSDIYEHCGMHPICRHCDGTFNITSGTQGKCRYTECDNICCLKCKYFSIKDTVYCSETCVNIVLYDKYYTLIENTLSNNNALIFQKQIIDDIVAFSVGSVFECCNEENQCQNEIVLDIGAFITHSKKDSNGDHVYFYKTQYLQIYIMAHQKTVCCQYGDKYRLFCSECTKQNGARDEFKKEMESYRIISNLINEFGAGFVFECGNREDECMNEVVFDGLYDFRMHGDYRGWEHRYRIYYYSPKYCDKQNKPIVTINGVHYRLFCSDCTNTKGVLKGCRCVTREKHRFKESGTTECGNHLRCNQCKDVIWKDSTNIKCKGCKHYFCPKCSVSNDGWLWCKPCIIPKEFNGLLGVMKSVERFNDQIAMILVEYSIGFIMDCCNCQNEIVFDNIWQFKKYRKDYRNKKIYYYYPKYSMKNRKILNVEYKAFRIFCDECTSTKLSKCWRKNCQISEIGARSRANQCGMHPICDKCGVSKGYKFINKCIKCRKYCCDKEISGQKSDVYGEQCNECYYNEEYRYMRCAVQRTLDKWLFCDAEIIKLITEFAMSVY